MITNSKTSESLEKIISDLQSEILKRDQKIAEANIEIASYKEKYARLIEEILLAKQHRFAPASEKNILQPDLFDEVGVELPPEVKETLEDETINIQGYTRKKHPVRRPLPAYLPREAITYDISPEEKICGCGEELVRIGEEISEQLKYIPAQVSVIQHIRPKYACKPCQENVKIAAMPTLLLPKSIATPELVAHTIISKYSDHLPLYRQESIWQRMEIDMPRSSLCGWLLKTAELCIPLMLELQKNIVQSSYVQADETTVQVLDEVGRSNTTKSYMWCYRNHEKNPTIVFDYEETRGGYHAAEFLKGFKGHLQTDAYSGYYWAHDHEEIISVGCNAHARRPFAELVKLSKGGIASDALKFYAKLYAIEKEAREKNLQPNERYQLRQNIATSIWDAFKKWLEHHLPKTSEQGKIGKAIRYCLKHWVELTNYLLDGRVEIDNNLVENTIRPFALGRKNWLFCGSPAGAKAGALFYSLIETCKANNLEPYQYFCAMLHRIRFCKSEEDYRNLLPQFIKI